MLHNIACHITNEYLHYIFTVESLLLYEAKPVRSNFTVYGMEYTGRGIMVSFNKVFFIIFIIKRYVIFKNTFCLIPDVFLLAVIKQMDSLLMKTPVHGSYEDTALIYILRLYSALHLGHRQIYGMGDQASHPPKHWANFF